MMQQLQPIKIDLSALMVEAEFGKMAQVDARHDVANAIHKATSDIGVDDLARKLYYAKGEVEIPPYQLQAVTDIIRRSSLLAFVKKAVLERLEIRNNMFNNIKGKENGN